MPLKLNIGFSRKVGERDYGSRGASTNLELELDSGVVDAPDRLRERIRQLFVLAKQSVDDELSSQQAQSTGHDLGRGHNGNGHSAPTPDGQANGRNQAADTAGRNASDRLATQSQVRAIYAIANRQQFDLTALLRDRFQIERPGDLRVSEASRLIDELNSDSRRQESRP